MRGRVGALVVVVAAMGCGGAGRGAADSGTGCQPGVNCDSGICVENRCVSQCSDVPGWSSCNYYAGELQYACCSPSQQCCHYGFEYYKCQPLDSPCPIECGGWVQCPVGLLCASSPSGVADGLGCLAPDFAQPSGLCSTDCPTEQRCGSKYCCLEGTRCAEVRAGYQCCVLDVPDGGQPDAASPDGPADAGAD